MQHFGQKQKKQGESSSWKSKQAVVRRDGLWRIEKPSIRHAVIVPRERLHRFDREVRRAVVAGGGQLTLKVGGKADGSRLGVVGAEEKYGAVGGDGEAVGQHGVEGGLPPEGGAEVVQRPLQACGADGGARVKGEEGDLLARKGLEGAFADHGVESAVVGEHLYVGARMLLAEGDEVGDVAQRVVLAAAGGT